MPVIFRTTSIEIASAANVAERWRSQYQRDGKWTRTASGDSEEIYNALCDLGRNPDIAAVATIIGNKSWSYLSCDGCDKYVTHAVKLNHGYSEKDHLLCRNCLERGIAAFDAVKG